MSAIKIKRILQTQVESVTQPLTIGGLAEDGSDAKIVIGSNGSISGITAADVGAAPTSHTHGDKANLSTEQAKTLSAASWTGASAPFTYTLAVTGVTTTSNQEIDTATNRTAAQLAAYQAANIQDGGQAANSLTLLAFGTKPTIDIPIRVILRGDK